MRVDEYQVTFWTRGQYPAAPPRNDEIRLFYRADFYIEQLFYCQNKSTACEERSLSWSFCGVFYFGLLDNFFTQELPL